MLMVKKGSPSASSVLVSILMHRGRAITKNLALQFAVAHSIEADSGVTVRQNKRVLLDNG